MNFIWKESFCIGNKDLDLLHEKEFYLLNKLLQAHNNGKSQSYLADILKRIIDHTSLVFDVEEKSFLRYGYPGSIEHKANHEEFMFKIIALKLMASKNHLKLTNRIFEHLHNWLLAHILIADKDFVVFETLQKINRKVHNSDMNYDRDFQLAI